MTIDVLEPGLSTTVQDAGRYGNYHIGMPPSGAMDQYAHEVANYLVGNDADAAALEMTYLGGEFEFDDEAVVAVTGADMSPTLGGDPIPMWEAHAVEAGDVLSFDYATEGVRAYLAVAGGIAVDSFMESKSTYSLIGIGGYEGRALEQGDTLAVGEPGARPAVGVSVPEGSVPDYGTEADIRVVMGLCDYRLSEAGREEFLSTEWTVSDEADRVGTRLDGPAIEPMFEEREQPFGAGPDVTNVVDLGYPVGSIQMAGQPIVLMRDAVTGGGYATIGTVISVDRDRLAQRRTHRPVTFESVSVDDALEAREAQQEMLEEIRSSV